MEIIVVFIAFAAGGPICGAIVLAGVIIAGALEGGRR